MSLGTVLILGGSSGIGLGVATEVIKSGNRVVIASSTQAKVDQAVDSLNKLAGETRAFGQTIDLSQADKLEENIVELLKYASSAQVTGNDSGKINHVVNTAGDGPKRVPLDEWTPSIAFNGWTVRYLTALTLGKHAPAYMVGDNTSSITVTSGTLATKPIKGYSTFIGQGGALQTIVLGLALDLAPIRVNIVSPGAIDTPLINKPGQEQVMEMYKQDNLLKTLGTPESCAQAYMYLFRDTFQTGTVLRTDGGRLLRS